MKKHKHKWVLNEKIKLSQSMMNGFKEYSYEYLKLIFICDKGCGEIKVHKIEL